MDPEIQRAHGHHYDQDPLHPTVEGSGEEAEPRPGKMSVMKRVRAKAKKIKGSLGMKSHSRDNDEHGSVDEEDDDDEETVDDPDVHGTPESDSEAAKNFVAGQGGSSEHSKFNSEDNVCPGTFQNKVSEPNVTPAARHESVAPTNFPVGHDVSSENSPASFPVGHGVGSEKSKPTLGDSLSSGESKPTFGEHVGDGVGSGKSKPTLGDSLSSGESKPTLGERLGDVRSGESQPTFGEDVGDGVGSRKSKPTLGDSLSSGESKPTLGERLGDVRSGESKPTFGEHVGDGVGSRESKPTLGDVFGSGQSRPTSGNEQLGEDLNVRNRGHQDDSPSKVSALVAGFEPPAPGTSPTGRDLPSGRSALGRPLGEENKHQDALASKYDTKAIAPGSGHEQQAPGHLPTGQDVGLGKSPSSEGSGEEHLRGDVDVPNRRHDDVDSGISSLGGRLGGEHLGEDTNVPRSGHQDVSPANHQTKVTAPGPVGREEAGVAPLLHSFDKMAIYDERKHTKPTTPPTGSHDQSPSNTPDLSTIPETTPSVPESFNAATDSHPQDMNVDKPATEQGGGYTSKIPAAITDKAAAARNVLASKFGFGGNDTENHPQDMNVDEPTTQPTGDGGYTGKFAAVTSAITDRAIAAKNVVASKVGYGGNDGNVPSSGVPISSTEDVTTSRSTEEAPKPQGTTYTEKLSYATSAFTGSAVSAKNAVASKVGYGRSDNAGDVKEVGSEVNRGDVNRGVDENSPKSGGGVTGYIAGAGTAVLSKIPGTGMGTQKPSGEETGTLKSPRETGSGVAGETDKGAGGVKGYLAEKLKPGEEDKALSEVISGTLHKRTKGVKGVDEEEKKGIGETVSDGFHKRNNEEEMYKEDKPMGKVTESEEVANRLGSSESERTGHVSATGEDSPSKGVVDKFKGAFTNWFGKGGETNPSQAFNDHTSTQGTETQEEERPRD